MKRDRETTLITENFMYPRFPIASWRVDGIKSFYCFDQIEPILTLVIEKNYCAVYGDTDTPLDILFTKPRLGHGAYYGTLIDGNFKAMASFRNGHWNKMGLLHTAPFTRATYNKLPPHKICIPAASMPHDLFGVLWT